LLSVVAKLLRIQFEMNGLLYGADYQVRAGALNHSPQV
jgi:hypothetical protein